MTTLDLRELREALLDPEPQTVGSPQRRPSLQLWVVVAAVLVGQALLLADLRVPVVRPVLGAGLLLGVPTYVLATWSFGRMQDRLVARQFAFGLSLLGAMVGGLLLNTVLPWVGVDRPLARTALVLASTVVDVGLLVACGLATERAWLPEPARLARLARTVWRARIAPEVGLAVLAVVCAVGGAIRLNNGYGGAIAVLGHALAVLALAVAFWRTPARTHAVPTIYLAGLALLLGTSLRGWYIVGHDIQSEYYSYSLTKAGEHWSMGDWASAYHACLSVNILPTVLGNVLGLDGVAVFKVVDQLIFALVPVAVYGAARMLFAPRVALMGAAVFMLFPTFLTDMPFLTRQEIAYLFVALSFAAATAAECRIAVRQGLTLAFGAGVVLSHYSTTYLLIITLAVSLAGSRLGPWALRWWRERRASASAHAQPATGRRARMGYVLLAPGVVVAIAALAWTWSTPVTHSGGHLSDTVTQLGQDLLHGKAVAGSSDLKFIGGGGPSATERFDTYYRSVLDARAANPATPIATSAADTAEPRLAEVPATPLTPVGSALHALGIPMVATNVVLRTAAGLALELLLVLGVIGLVLRVRATAAMRVEPSWLVLGSLAAVGVIVVVPGLSTDYGVLRAFQQTLLLVAPLVGVGLLMVLSRLRRMVSVATLVLLGLGWALTGVVGGVLGGYPGVLSQADSGQYYDLLYVDAPEMSAAHWLADDLQPRGVQFVGASDIVSITRLQTILPRRVAVTPDFLPVSLSKGEYLFLTPQTVTHGRGTVFSSGDLITYAYPRATIASDLDLIYSTTGTEIYR